jgi:hypothetical protein
MTEENHERRIAVLEKQMSVMLPVLEKYRSVFEKAHQSDTQILKMVIRLHEQYIDLFEFILKNPNFVNHPEREKMLTEIAGHKKEWDEVALPFLRLTLLPPLPPENSPGMPPPPSPPA